MTAGVRSVGYLIRLYRGLFAGVGLAALVTSMLEGLHLLAFYPLFHRLFGDRSALPSSGLLRTVLEAVERLPWGGSLTAAVFLLVGVTSFKCAAAVLRDAAMAWASGWVQYDLRNRLMRVYADSSPLFFLSVKQGQLVYNLSTATSRVGALAQKIPQLFSEGLKGTVVVAVLLATFPTATVGLLGVGFLYHRLTRFLSSKVSYHTGKGRVVAGAEQVSIANEFLSGIRPIVVFGSAPAWLERFRRQNQAFRDLFVKDAIWISIPRNLLEFSSILILAAGVLWAQGQSHGSMTSQLSLLGVFALGLLKLLPSLTLLGQLRMEVTGLTGDAELLHEALTLPEPASHGGRQPFSSLRQGIVLERVSFHYPEKEPLFQEIDLSIGAGKVTALVGPSGSGKTSIAHLILGLLSPDRGRILVDGTDLREIRIADWRGRVGWVSQEMFLIHATVADNIRFGRSGVSMEEIGRAAQAAHAHSFIEQLPQGYETVVGERGMKLSGGQQQRLAIARAILHRPELLIFDEATSFLDPESERLVRRAMEEACRGRTVILITHRLESVRNVDQIFVIDQGRVAEEGRPGELFGEQGRYFRGVVPSGEGKSA